MFRRFAAVILLSILVLSPNAVFAQQQPQSAAAAASTPSNDPVDRIKDEGMNRSQVMKTLSYLTDVIGPRLTNSPNMKRANEWTRDEMTRWGLQNAHLEPWGPFGRGWSLKRFSAQVTEPQSIPLIAFPKAWSPGTNGTITADVVYLNAKDDAELQQFKGKLKGAIVFTSPMREVKARFDALSTRRERKSFGSGRAGTAPVNDAFPNVSGAEGRPMTSGEEVSVLAGRRCGGRLDPSSTVMVGRLCAVGAGPSQVQQSLWTQHARNFGLR